MAENRILLRGRMEQPPVYSHESHGKTFYLAVMAVPRLSGTVDRLNLLLPEKLVGDLAPGAWVEVTGQVRSFNNRSGTGSRLVITVLARTLKPAEGAAENQLRLRGNLCRPPVFRRTPLGREICDLMLAVPRGYGRSDYLPCIAWGSLAAAVSRLEVGSPLVVEGRLQSRSYIKALPGGEEERVAYEVSVMNIEEDDGETVRGCR